MGKISRSIDGRQNYKPGRYVSIQASLFQIKSPASAGLYDLSIFLIVIPDLIRDPEPHNIGDNGFRISLDDSWSPE
jgi:hypothetical protein